MRATLLDHADHLRQVIGTHTTQTNEVNRSTYVSVLLHLGTADLPGAPVQLLELGASAGLLLDVDRYAVRVGSVSRGASPVVCEALDRSREPLTSLDFAPIVSRTGIDRHPADLRDEDTVRWLKACLWPEVPGRIERFDAAVALWRADPPRIVAGDMVADLPALLGQLPADGHLVVFSSWALTYVERGQRDSVAVSLARAAADGRPVTWLSAEPPGCVPGVPVPDHLVGGGLSGTVLAGRRWRDGSELEPVTWGTSHAHGTWIELD